MVIGRTGTISRYSSLLCSIGAKIHLPCDDHRREGCETRSPRLMLLPRLVIPKIAPLGLFPVLKSSCRCNHGGLPKKNRSLDKQMTSRDGDQKLKRGNRYSRTNTTKRRYNPLCNKAAELLITSPKQCKRQYRGTTITIWRIICNKVLILHVCAIANWFRSCAHIRDSVTPLE